MEMEISCQYKIEISKSFDVKVFFKISTHLTFYAQSDLVDICI